MSRTTTQCLLAASAAMAAYCAPASVEGQGTAGAARAWVSGHGTDRAGCGSPTAPCRSLQYVHDNVVGDGGEIDILDPAGYGAVSITKAVSIVNDGVGTACVQATSGNAITINAGPSASVFLRGLNVDGVGAAGVNGIAFKGGAGFTVVNCVVRHFAQEGIVIQPPSGPVTFLIQDTIASDNNDAGILLGGNAWTSTAAISGIIARATVMNNKHGVYFDDHGDIVSNDNTGARVVIDDTDVSNNTQTGISLIGSLFVEVHGDLVVRNGESGLSLAPASHGVISRSMIIMNGLGTGFDIVNGGVLQSTGDNQYLEISGATSGWPLQ